MIFKEAIMKMKFCQVLGQVVRKLWVHIKERVSKLVTDNHGATLVFSRQVRLISIKILNLTKEYSLIN